MGRLKALAPRLAPAPTRLAPLQTDRQQTRELHTGSSSWRRLREAVLIRDGYSCRACGRLVAGKHAHVDHIDGNSHNNDLGNLQILCIEGHSRKTQAEKAGRVWDQRCR